MRKLLLLALSMMLLVVAACGGGQATQTPTNLPPTEDNSSQAATDEPTAAPTTEAATEEAAEASTEAVSDATEEAGDATEEASATTAELPEWMTMTLKDLRTEEEFTIADLLGKTIYVQVFDTLTPENKTHLTALKEAMTQLGDENFTFLLLEGSISPLPAARLLRFLDDGGEYTGLSSLFPAPMRPLMARDLGNQVLAISLVPHFAIRVDGTVTDLRLRPESAEALVTWLQAVDEGSE